MEFEIEEDVKIEEPEPKETPKEEEPKEKIEPEPEKPEPTEIETLATEMGWRSDGKDKEGKTVDAKTYIRKGRDIQDTMRGHIKDQKQQLSDLGHSIEDLKIHNKQVYKAEVAKLKTELTALQKEKKVAVADADVELVDELDEKIDGVKEAMEKPEAQETSTENPKFNEWAKTNTWYRDDPEMAAYADTIADKHTGAPFERVAALVTKQVKEMFPEKFSEPKKPAASPVEGATKKTTTTKFTKADLTENQKSIMKQFVRQGIMTEKAYIEDIAKLKEAA
jgi:site-specific DNA-cytosine methylase